MSQKKTTYSKAFHQALDLVEKMTPSSAKEFIRSYRNKQHQNGNSNPNSLGMDYPDRISDESKSK